MRGAKGVIVSIVGGEDMRLMEVDEAANHIRELVDPDANIIWGSAFNANLNGKIRVSVVATGIDVEASASQPKSQPFRLGDMGVGVARPAAAMTTPLTLTPPEPVANGLDLDLGEEAPPVQHFIPAESEPVEARAPAEHRFATATFDDITGEDELVLDSAMSAEPLIVEPPVPVAEQPKAAGGTLFERMSQLARGQARSEDEEDSEPRRSDFEVPRFLNRQNNQ
jgi:cell division protein FtsZ